MIEPKSFADAAGDLRVILTGAALASITSIGRKHAPKETGGILIGTYAGRIADIHEATAPPRDSRATRTTFERGTHGLLRLLQKRWSAGEHYIGEWHAHPNASPHASLTDLTTLEGIARDEAYRCPAPILAVHGIDAGVPALFVAVRWPDGIIERLRELDGTLQ